MLKTLALLCLATLHSGCTYLHDRGRDACDVVTVSVETGLANAAVQIGSATIGVGSTSGMGIGLRSGALGVYHYTEGNLVLLSSKELIPDIYDEERGKGYDYACFISPFPSDEDCVSAEMIEGGSFNLWQLELTATLGLGVRVGLNFAELADFFLGLIGVDFLEDDRATLEKRVADSLRSKAEFQPGPVVPAK